MNLEETLREIELCEDPVQRAEQYSDLAFDAEMLAEKGNREIAQPIFEAIYNLDHNDDLLLPAIEVAEEYLLKWRVVDPPNAVESERRLEAEE